MYSLLMSSLPGHWDRSPADFPADRIFEHTAKALVRQFEGFASPAVDDLLACPALFAYESPVGVDARVGRVTRIRRRAGRDVRIGFELDNRVPPIPPDRLLELAWELDIIDWEFSRTHWAVKDVDLMEELAAAGILRSGLEGFGGDAVREAREMVVRPVIFKVPKGAVERDLVSVMRPFTSRFDCVSDAITEACARVGLRCRDANMEWEESEIIQDIFSLLYRSRVVVCDFSGQNPNVFYEAGIAHTLGRAVVPIVSDGSDIPFDPSHHRYLAYKTDPDGLEELADGMEKRLRSLLKTGR